MLKNIYVANQDNENSNEVNLSVLTARFPTKIKSIIKKW